LWCPSRRRGALQSLHRPGRYAASTFYRDTLGVEVRHDVDTTGCAGSRSATPDQPGTSIVPESPAADPGITDDERRTITEMMAKAKFPASRRL
jgi:hypothetical protein